MASISEHFLFFSEKISFRQHYSLLFKLVEGFVGLGFCEIFWDAFSGHQILCVSFLGQWFQKFEISFDFVIELIYSHHRHFVECSPAKHSFLQAFVSKFEHLYLLLFLQLQNLRIQLVDSVDEHALLQRVHFGTVLFNVSQLLPHLL